MLPLVVVAHDDPGTADSLRHAVETAAGWRVAVAEAGQRGLGAALAAGPAVALVGCAVLADLPAGCRTPVLAVGDDDRPADLRTALAAGARGLLAWPDGAADLTAELARVAAAGQPATAGPGAAPRPPVSPSLPAEKGLGNSLGKSLAFERLLSPSQSPIPLLLGGIICANR